MTIEIGTRCEIVNTAEGFNEGAQVVVVGDAGVRITRKGRMQCYFMDRELTAASGRYTNVGPEFQLKPLPPLCEKQEKKELLTV